MVYLMFFICILYILLYFIVISLNIFWKPNSEYIFFPFMGIHLVLRPQISDYNALITFEWLRKLLSQTLHLSCLSPVWVTMCVMCSCLIWIKSVCLLLLVLQILDSLHKCKIRVLKQFFFLIVPLFLKYFKIHFRALIIA